MYKIFDWIANNRRIAIFLAVFIVFLMILGILVLLQGTDRRNSQKSLEPLQGSQLEFSVNWWMTTGQSGNTEAINDITRKFNEKYPNVKFTVTEKQTDLQFIEEFLSNPDSQPDLMTVNSNNMSFYQKYSMPNAYFKNQILGDYLERSVDTVKNNNVFSGEVYGVPLQVDNMQMYVNKNLLNNIQGSKTYAKDWETLKIQASSFDKTKGQSLIALGSGKDIVKNFPDILGAMMVQKGIFLDAKNKEIKDQDLVQILKDYNYFKQYLTQTQNDFDSFKQGKSLYYIDYFSANSIIKTEAPQLDYEITDIPKYSNGINISHSRFFTTMAHKKYILDQEKKRILDDLTYFLSTEEAQQIFATKTGLPSANKKIVGAQYKEKSDSDNNRRFFDQAIVARAILPACSVRYNQELQSLLLNIQSKGTSPTTEEINAAVFTAKPRIFESVYAESVCLPYKFQE
jgi:ABC-type glycerol-3-phosphate transport system substrate-binding protein